MTTNSIKPGLRPRHVIQILWCALKKGITNCERPNLRPDTPVQAQMEVTATEP